MFFSTQHIRNTIEYTNVATYTDKNSFKAVGNTTFDIWLDNLPYLVTLGFHMENPTTIKQEYQEPAGLENAQVDVDIDDCKLSRIILAIIVNVINAKKTQI